MSGKTERPELPSVSIVFFMYYLVQNRPVMSEDAAVDYLEKLQRVLNLFDHVFYVKLWMAALTGLAEEPVEANSTGHYLLWKSFVLVKLPTLIEKLEERKSSRLSHNGILPYEQFEGLKYSCHECVINQLFGFHGLFSACNQHFEETIDVIFQAPDVSVDILKVCLKKNLVRREFVLRLFEDRSIELWSGSDSTDSDAFTVNILDDPSSQNIDHLISTSSMHQESRVTTILKLVTTWSANKELKPLAILCRSINENPSLLDIIHLYRHPSEFLGPLEKLCNAWEKLTNDNSIESYIQDYENFGIIFLLLVSIIDRYEFHKNLKDVLRDENGFCHTWILQSSVAYEHEMLDPEKLAIVEPWVNALLSYQNITDQIIRTTNPRVLIELAPTIFKTTFKMWSDETFSNLEIFLNPHTSYALIGVVQWLCDDICFKGQNSLSSKILKILMSNVNFPQPIIRLMGEKLLSIFDRPTGSLPSVEDDETINELKIAALTLEPSWTVSKHPSETLFSRFKIMFKSIVYCGRQRKSTLNIDYEYESLQADLSSDLSWWGPHHLDTDLFRACLEIHGPKIFVGLIVEEILSAGEKGTGLRAAELGASLITLPLCYTWNAYLQPPNLIHILFTEVLPRALEKKITMYSQGRALGFLTFFVLMTSDRDSCAFGKRKAHEDFSKEVWKPLTNGPARGFIDGLISHNDIGDKFPELALKKFLISLGVIDYDQGLPE
ncbi:3828_t:CDS:10 [Acaulospora morrowiae]|uniref:Mediator of RNA polymerase II transcription subunit 5 n=1 Tax=Acaulospora morrowiae TaxID=94023 RepID=A0A9N8YXS6_9GLOM|nr:3828_t:CDS:10 [Acaulospora morrowiae]